MDEVDIHKTAFHVGSSGLYEFTCMPFGLSHARASFCHLMEMCLGDQQYLMLLFFLDDICIFSSSVNEMLDRIALVFSQLKEFNLKIKPKKSFFFQSSVLFLGHLLSKDDILPNLEKVSKVKDWLIPTSAKEVHSFLGLASYYRRFIPQLAKWASPLHDLIHPIAMTKKHAQVKLPPLAPNLPPFKRTTEHLESFNKLKEALTSAPVLAYPDYMKPFILETDASLKGLGTVLTQEDDKGNYCLISYASHMHKPYEHSMRNYSSAKLELLVLKWAICEKFKDDLIGSKFTILTDNNPLTYVHTFHLGAAQIHWLSDLMLFDFEIKYRAGKSNQVADALSQWPVNPNSSYESLDDDGEWETLSYGMVCQILNHHFDSTKMPYNVKLGVQNNIAEVNVANQSLGFPKSNIIDVQLCEVKLSDTITPKQMAEY